MIMGNHGMLVLGALLTPAYAAVEQTAPVWTADWQTARAQAAAEGKLLLVDFTGSDWCRYCILLKKNVLDKPEFAAYAEGKFVLVEVDLPNSGMEAATRARNEELCKRLGVGSFPTVMVLTPEEELLGGFVGGAMEMQQVQECLDKAYANRAKLLAARATIGEARAKLLMEIYSSLDAGLQRIATAYKDEIRQNDPEDVCGLGREEAAMREMDAFSAELAAAGADWRVRLRLVEDQTRRAMPENKPALLILQSKLTAYGADSEADVLAAKKLMLAAADLLQDKAAAGHLRNFAERSFADPAAFVIRARQIRSRIEGPAPQPSSHNPAP